MEAREDDMMEIHIKVFFPEWLDDLSVEEFNNVLIAARRKASMAFNCEIAKAEKFWRDRKAQSEMNQMNIYDYV